MSAHDTNQAETRTWRTKKAQVYPEKLPETKFDLYMWLEQNPPTAPVYLLIHALDGVNWGRIDENGIKISHDVDRNIAPPLHPKTLQQVRIFNDSAEILLWRVGQHWQQRILIEIDLPADSQPMAFDETHLLWGTAAERQVDGFTLLADGAQGLRHIVPYIPHILLNQRLALQVRHYLEKYDNGIQYIAYSRLVGFTAVRAKKE
jgi:CRISPR-associated protein (TIGR03984 family)